MTKYTVDLIFNEITSPVQFENFISQINLHTPWEVEDICWEYPNSYPTTMIPITIKLKKKEEKECAT